jgi:osmotically inducible protein OsmC
MDLKKPKEMGGEGGSFTNPEQLFAGAYGACYLGALGSVAKRENVDVTEASVDVHVSFNKESDTAFALSAELHVKIPGIDVAQAQQLADKAHHVCPYSKATRNNIDVKVIAE